jgi:hypothetical protein
MYPLTVWLPKYCTIRPLSKKLNVSPESLNGWYHCGILSENVSFHHARLMKIDQKSCNYSDKMCTHTKLKRTNDNFKVYYSKRKNVNIYYIF